MRRYPQKHGGSGTPGYGLERGIVKRIQIFLPILRSILSILTPPLKCPPVPIFRTHCYYAELSLRTTAWEAVKNDRLRPLQTEIDRMNGTELHHSHKIPPFKALQSRFSVILPAQRAVVLCCPEKVHFWWIDFFQAECCGIKFTCFRSWPMFFSGTAEEDSAAGSARLFCVCLWSTVNSFFFELQRYLFILRILLILNLLII